MDEDKIIASAIEYIKTHAPKETEFETIDHAISVVSGGQCHAATNEHMVNPDDVWLIPKEERDILVGIRGRGWASSIDDEAIQKLKDAVQYAIEHADIINHKIDDNHLSEMEAMQNDSSNIYKNDNYDNKFIK